MQFLNTELALTLIKEYGSPLFVYSEKELEEKALSILNIDAPFGKTIRFAMKANPNKNILQIFNKLGIQIDASSGFEAERAILAGIKPENILLTAQELPKNLLELLKQGVQFNACSLHQLKSYGAFLPNSNISIRINPGQGTGFHSYTNVGGPDASFGIWHEEIPQIQKICTEFNLNVVRIHTHIGSGTDPNIWKEVAKTSIALLHHFPNAKTLNLGGGFKIARMSDEKETKPEEVGEVIKEVILDFYKKTNREIHIELEPGTYLTANSGAILSTIQDISSSGKNGHIFYKLDCGMSEILRPAFYGAQHPIEVFTDETNTQDAVVVGHSCESADIITTEKNNGEKIKARNLAIAKINDPLAIYGAGAYCSSMSAKNYNSFPEVPEVLIEKTGKHRLIRKRQSMEQMLINEI